MINPKYDTLLVLTVSYYLTFTIICEIGVANHTACFRDKITLLTGGRDSEAGCGEFDGLERACGDGVVGGGGDDGRVVPRRHVRHRLDRLLSVD